ncbi:hypothetical protein B0H14DRAFT_3773290 [Mycena olivaceomarginata]|nr:hypothetical protein B0H14DRAFT_3773290 [Mycena olivaceomarginata]
MATGGGKSAVFAVPIIVLKEMARNPDLYPDLPTRALPMGIVITPTKGLAANIVLELKKLNVPAFAYCHETVTAARMTGRNLVKDIQACSTWNVICVDPEHLRDKAWRQITASDTFRANIVYGCADEAHLINEWGASFRPPFKHVGAFFSGPTTLLYLRHGPLCNAAARLCDNQYLPQSRLHGIGGKEFPDLLRYLNSGRKTVVHCRTIDDVYRVFIYLWNCLPVGGYFTSCSQKLANTYQGFQKKPRFRLLCSRTTGSRWGI